MSADPNALVVGIDFGTLSGRAVMVRVSDGAELGSAVHVAKRAGVSHQTVSRVINGHPSVRHEMRQPVGVAITELGYRPNRAARTLVRGRSETVGVIAHNTPRHGPSPCSPASSGWPRRPATTSPY